MIVHAKWFVSSALVLTILLTGCADLTTSSDQGTRLIPSYKESLDLDGRMTIKYQQDGNDEFLHGSFNWAQTAQRTVITLKSPLGQTMAVIEVMPGKSVLTQNGQPKRMAADPDTLTELTLGWPLPISGMRDWLQGYATDAKGNRFIASPQSDPASNVATQDGWRITYVNWQDASGSLATSRPKRIDLARSTPQAGEVFIKLVIDNWQPH